MARTTTTLTDVTFLQAALEGLELQKERLEAQIQEVKSRLGKSSARGAKAKSSDMAPAKKRDLSPAARKRISAAQKRRWAEYRKRVTAEAKGKAKGAAEA